MFEGEFNVCILEIGSWECGQLDSQASYGGSLGLTQKLFKQKNFLKNIEKTSKGVYALSQPFRHVEAP